MMSIRRAVYNPVSLMACAILSIFISPATHSQSAPPDPAGKSPASSLMQQMTGTWSVRQQMWPGYGAEAIKLPSAIARRQVIGGAFLEEVMELEPGTNQKPFTRTAYFNFNTISHQYEYFSLDSRLPQMMNERSHPVQARSESDDKHSIVLYGGNFVAPQWGKATNVAFTYRLTIRPVENDNQVVQLYLTPRAGKDTREFLAFEYTYTRQP